MKLPVIASKASLILAGAAALTLSGFQARAGIAALNIPGNEITVFSNDLDDDTAWTSTGDPGTFGAAENGEIVWRPTNPGTSTLGGSPAIAHTLDTPLNIENGPINIYIRLQVQLNIPPGSGNNKVNFGLSGAGGNNGRFQMQISPGSVAATQYIWTGPFGADGQVVSTAFTASTIAFENYRLTLTSNGDTTYGLAAYVYNAGSGVYDVWGTGVPNDIVLDTTSSVLGAGGTPGDFSVFAISQRNSGVAAGLQPAALNADWLDAVAVTQTVIPEPSTYAMLLAGLFAIFCVRGLSRKGHNAV